MHLYYTQVHNTAMSTTTAMEVEVEEDMITIDDLPYLDLNSFTQSELLSLCRSSKSYYEPSLSSDLLPPSINRAVFNESAGSRRQTYSRVRLRNPHHRTPRILPTRPDSNTSSYPDNHAIVHFLKHFLDHGPNSTPPTPRPQPQLQLQSAPQPHQSKPLELGKRKGEGGGVVLGRVNRKGEEVDLEVLGREGDGFFEGELKRRSEGFVTEEEVLGFMSGLEGAWCSRRKRRKYVDADQFGEVLPIGWRVLLGLRRRDGSVTVYCRRFVRLFNIWDRCVVSVFID